VRQAIKSETTYIVLNLGNLGTLVGALAEGVTNFDRTSLLSETLEELVVNPSLHEDTGTSAACLPVVPAVTHFSSRTYSRKNGELTRYHAQPSSLPDLDPRRQR